MYSYVGSDGKWHTADLERLKEWAQQGYVEPYAPVIETATGKQTRADALPDLQPFFAARFDALTQQRAAAATADAAASTARARDRKKATTIAFGTAMVVMIAFSVARYLSQAKQLPLVMPPALPGAVPAPDLTEAVKFTGRWQYTQHIHHPNRDTTRSSDLIIQPEQRLMASISTHSVITASDGQSTPSGGHSFSLQWSQQKDAQGRRLWVVRRWQGDPPTGLYYRFDKAGTELSLTAASAGTSSLSSHGDDDEDRDDITGIYRRLPEAPQQKPMRKRDLDALKRGSPN